MHRSIANAARHIYRKSTGPGGHSATDLWVGIATGDTKKKLVLDAIACDRGAVLVVAKTGELRWLGVSGQKPQYVFVPRCCVGVDFFFPPSERRANTSTQH